MNNNQLYRCGGKEIVHYVGMLVLSISMQVLAFSTEEISEESGVLDSTVDITTDEFIGGNEEETGSETDKNNKKEENNDDEDEDEDDDDESETVKKAYGPRKGSVLFSFSGNGMLFHISDVSDEEDRFVNTLEMKKIYQNKDGQPIDTVSVAYTYSGYSGSIGVQYFLSERTGIGAQYEYAQTTQDFSNLHEMSSELLLETQSLGALLTVYVFQKKRIGASLSGTVGAVWGELYRMPILFADAEEHNGFSSEDLGILRQVHEKVTLNGLDMSLNVQCNYMINRFMTVYGGPRYLYRYLILTDDRLDGYFKTINAHDIAFNINFAFLLFGKN